MRAIQTRLTRLLGSRHPLLGAPMAGAAGGILAARVSAAGAFGFIGTNHTSLASAGQEISLARQELGLDERLPIGIGFMAWRLEEIPRSDAEHLLATIAPDVTCIWVSFGRKCKHWIRLINSLSSGASDAGGGKRCTSALLVNSVDEAVEAYSWDPSPDILVLQGWEAGGHGAHAALPIISFATAVQSAVKSEGFAPDHPKSPIVLGAGGVATGSQMAALLTLGMDGVVCGTRLLATPEATYSDAQKSKLVKARGEDTVRTMVFDTMRGTLGWPTGIDGRALSNATLADELAGVPEQELRRRYKEAAASGDTSRIVTWAGTSVTNVNRVRPAKAIVEEIVAEAIAAIDRTHALLR